MTTSQVKARMDALAQRIAALQETKADLTEQVQTLEDNLSNIPTAYAEVLAEVGGYTPTGSFEELAVDEKDKLTTEFLAIKSAVTAALAALG